MYTLNPSTGQWKHLTNIPAARSFPAVVSVTSDKIIVIGGMTNKNTEYSNTVFVGVFNNILSTSYFAGYVLNL